MKDLTILHVFPDEKFFDPISITYDHQDGIINLYYLYTPNKDYKFKFIKLTDKVTIINDKKEYLDLFSSEDIDVILFHSLRKAFLDLFKYIDKKKIVIWWSWGGDIYNRIFEDVKPLISWNLYKPITNQYFQENNANSQQQRKTIRQRLRLIKHKYIIWKIIRRVDLFIPCIPIDYKLLKKQCKFFHANIFSHPGLLKEFKFVCHEEPKNILIGNSFTYTNNHLDIFERIYNYTIDDGRKYVIPVNYGWGKPFGNNPDNLIALCKLKSNTTVWLKDYIERDKYFELFNNITHAIFGVLRQQALANIYSCLRNGIKVYLYKDSLVAKQLKEDGFIFFTIDDDLTEESLSKCLSYDDAFHNYQLMVNRNKNKASQSFLQNKLNECLKNR